MSPPPPPPPTRHASQLMRHSGTGKFWLAGVLTSVPYLALSRGIDVASVMVGKSALLQVDKYESSERWKLSEVGKELLHWVSLRPPVTPIRSMMVTSKSSGCCERVSAVDIPAAPAPMIKTRLLCGPDIMWWSRASKY